jgi:hypothetical protein
MALAHELLLGQQLNGLVVLHRLLHLLQADKTFLASLLIQAIGTDVLLDKITRHKHEIH